MWWRLIFISGLAAVGCAQKQPVAEKSTAVQSAEQLERKANLAYSKGDAITAAKDYQTASNVYQSLAMVNEFALAQISLARIDSDDGRIVQALAHVNYFLRQAYQGAPISDSTKLLANGRAAALYLQQQDLSSADASLASAEALCVPTCSAIAALETLRANWYLASGNAAAAQAKADRAYASATTAVDKANALRTLAQSRMALGALDQATSDAKQALQTDQTLGLAKRVITDLDLLVSIYTKANNSQKANEYKELSHSAQMALHQLSGK